MQQLITLVTDWGEKDPFAGMVKAKLYSAIPSLQVIDISHQIKRNDIRMAAFVVKNACLKFPPNTIHIIDIDSVETTEHSHVVLYHNQQYYICSDNGLPALVFPEKPEKIIKIEMHQDSNFYTFAGLDVFSKVAIALASGLKLEEIGYEKDSVLQRSWPLPTFSGDELRANVIYVDGYGNAYLNITDEEFSKYCNGRKFELTVNRYTIDRIFTSYDDVRGGELVLTVSATGLLQLAINRGDITKLCSINVDESIRFRFF